MIEASSASGDVWFDGKTISIRRTSRIARSVFGDIETVIAIDHITAVEWKAASLWRAGHIRFAVPGTQAAAFPRPLNRDTHAVLFGRKEQGAFEQMRLAVQAKLG